MANVGNGPSAEFLADQEVIGPIFNDSTQNERGCTINSTNAAGTDYDEIPAGTIIAKTRQTGAGWGPCAYAKANGAGAAVTALVISEDEGSEIDAFKKGDWLFIGSAVHPVKIDSVNEDTKTLTLASAQTWSDEDELNVDPSVSVATTGTITSANDAVLQTADDYKKFRVGDTIQIDGISGARKITAIDSGTNTLTFDGTAGSAVAGATVVSQAVGQYRVMTRTMQFGYGNGYSSSNYIAHWRDRGEAFKKRIRGMNPARQTALEPVLYFNNSK